MTPSEIIGLGIDQFSSGTSSIDEISVEIIKVLQEFGYKIVTREPSIKMIDAGRASTSAYLNLQQVGVAKERESISWQAMWDAA